MGGLYFILPTLLVIFVSFLVVRAAAIALMMTGLDEKRAKFQALSAFTGTGFTTREAESVVTHPKRRRIITWLMILGNAGIHCGYCNRHLFPCRQQRLSAAH